MVFLGYLTCTSEITPHPTLLKVCEEFKIGYSQLTPTAVLMFQAFHFRVVRVGLPVSVSLFKALFTLHRPNKMPFFYFHPRVPYQFVKSVKLSLGKWKTYFFYVRAPTFDVPVVWNPTCESFTITANMAKRIEESGLCDVEFDPRGLIPTVKDGGITFAALRAKANGTSKKASKKLPSTLGDSSSGLLREETHVETPRIVADDRSSAGEGEGRPPKRDRGKGKRVDTEYVAVPKRLRVDPEETYAFHGGGGKQLFTYGVNRDGKESYWDVSDHDLPMLSTEGFVLEYDRARMSGKGPSHMLELAGGDICRLVATWRYLVEHGRNVEARKEEERVRSQTREDELLSQLEIARSDLAQRTEELAQRTEELEVIRGDAKAYKDDVHKLNECYDQLKEKYEVEKATGKRFLATSGGAAYRESIVEETKLSFRGSDECAAMIEEHALAVVYKPLVRACRQYLRDAGGISEKVIRGMEAGISDGEDDEVDVDGTGTELVADMVASTVGTSSARSRAV
ncbi:PREDICTED: uncharacterized protein LOC105951172 [Erythranthe guttata]|uniref:uncharacterized protein LOC105951172 n=1 Tax=Erythranthe guttata TaxID=4155 RepID=UPI00064D7AAB|nr:PREDICTED: uncharacterized protein LOC105951172 [Erythranthe guttata]|eukprot:XP_012830018.1 PREDICTED: uncharacterized protein LOC105951172 [Erythranthe guttata]